MTSHPYQHIAEILREEIKTDVWKPGLRLESRSSLADRFGVSEMTVNNAISLLEREGWVVRRHGKGVYVVPAAERHPYEGSALTELWTRVTHLEETLAAGLSEISARIDNLDRHDQ